VKDDIHTPGKRVITFSHVLSHNTFPLAEILDTLLVIGQKEMGNPIEIEFAANLDTPPGQPKIFSFLQIRPIVANEQRITFQIDKVNPEETIVYSEAALGNGIIDNIYDLVYIKPESFKSSATKAIALEIEQLNQKFIQEKRNYVLIGPGRWGSSDPWLGIPVKWPQISEARIIIESGLDKYRIDPSQGTHFFQNITTFGVGYMTINPYLKDGFLNIAYLSSQLAHHESGFLRHIRFSHPIIVKIDGRQNIGVIYKEG
jgi:hypothetical protein